MGFDVDSLLRQFGLDGTFFVQFGILGLTFVLLSHVYFKPFLKLFELRYKKTTQDRKAASDLLSQAQLKLEEYSRILAEERALTRKSYEQALIEAKKQEEEMLRKAREESAQLLQEALRSVAWQREDIKKRLKKDVDSIAAEMTERLLCHGGK